jgi:hypothetical protein
MLPNPVTDRCDAAISPAQEKAMTIKGKCYCGATEFELDAAPESVTACTCSYCSKTGALWAYFTPEQVRFTRLEHDALFAPRANRHHFCSVCGMTTHTESPTWDLATKAADFSRMRISVNARLLEAFDLAGVEHKTIDGRNLW